MYAGSNVHYKGKETIISSLRMAFDMGKDAFYRSHSLALFSVCSPLFVKEKKISTNPPHSTPDGEISQVNCVFVCYVWCEVWLMSGTFPLHSNLRKRRRMFFFFTDLLLIHHFIL